LDPTSCVINRFFGRDALDKGADGLTGRGVIKAESISVTTPAKVYVTGAALTGDIEKLPRQRLPTSRPTVCQERLASLILDRFNKVSESIAYKG